MQYDPKDDAYRHDATGRSLAGLEIIINLDNVDPVLLKTVTECLQTNKAFILHGEDSLILFDPANLHAIEKPDNNSVYYIDAQQFLNGVKLALLAFPEIIVLTIGIGAPTEQPPGNELKKPPM